MLSGKATDGFPENTSPGVYNAQVFDFLVGVYLNTYRPSLAEDAISKISLNCKSLSDTDPGYPVCSGLLVDAGTNLGLVYYNTGRLKDSEKVLLDTLPRARDFATRFPMAKIALFNILNNITAVYTDEGKFNEAEVTANEALKLASDFPSPLRDSTSSTIEINLGHLYFTAKQFDQAEKYFALALETRRQLALHAPGGFRPDVAMILVDLSLVYENTNRVNDALKALTEAVDIYRQESVHNLSVPATFIKALIEMAELESQSGQFEDAGKALQEAKNTIATLPNLDVNSRAALSQQLDELIRKSQRPPTHEP